MSSLDVLFGLPSAGVTLREAGGFEATGLGSVGFAADGRAYGQLAEDIDCLVDADTRLRDVPVEVLADYPGYTWLTVRRVPGDLPLLVQDLHALSTVLRDHGFGCLMLSAVVSFRDAAQRVLGLVHLYGRGTFYPFGQVPEPGGSRRDRGLERQVSALIAGDVPVEEELGRWWSASDCPAVWTS